MVNKHVLNIFKNIKASPSNFVFLLLSLALFFALPGVPSSRLQAAEGENQGLNSFPDSSSEQSQPVLPADADSLTGEIFPSGFPVTETPLPPSLIDTREFLSSTPLSVEAEESEESPPPKTPYPSETPKVDQVENKLDFQYLEGPMEDYQLQADGVTYQGKKQSFLILMPDGQTKKVGESIRAEASGNAQINVGAGLNLGINTNETITVKRSVESNKLTLDTYYDPATEKVTQVVGGRIFEEGLVDPTAAVSAYSRKKNYEYGLDKDGQVKERIFNDRLTSKAKIESGTNGNKNTTYVDFNWDDEYAYDENGKPFPFRQGHEKLKTVIDETKNQGNEQLLILKINADERSWSYSPIAEPYLEKKISADRQTRSIFNQTTGLIDKKILTGNYQYEAKDRASGTIKKSFSVSEELERRAGKLETAVATVVYDESNTVPDQSPETTHLERSYKKDTQGREELHFEKRTPSAKQTLDFTWQDKKLIGASIDGDTFDSEDSLSNNYPKILAAWEEMKTFEQTTIQEFSALLAPLLTPYNSALLPYSDSLGWNASPAPTLAPSE